MKKNLIALLPIFLFLIINGIYNLTKAMGHHEKWRIIRIIIGLIIILGTYIFFILFGNKKNHNSQILHHK